MRSRFVVSISVLGAAAWLALAVVPGRAGEEEEARNAVVTALGRSYLEAFAAGDADAVAACFWPDGEYVDEAGVITEGRDAIREIVAGFFAAYPGAKIEAVPESRRFPGPNLAVSTGIVTVLTAEGDVLSRSRYTTVATTDGRKWHYASMRDFQLGEGSFDARERLDPLAWLVGEWGAKNGGVESTGTCRWAENGAWLVMEFSTKVGDEVTRRTTQRVGWDPMRRRFRSWSWDSDGGFSEALWSEMPEGWVLHSRGVSSAGDQGTGTYTLTRLTDDSFRWRSRNVAMGDQPIPDEDRVIRRRKGSK